MKVSSMHTNASRGRNNKYYKFLIRRLLAKATANARARSGLGTTGKDTILNLTDTNFINNTVLRNNTTAGNVAGGAIYSK